MPIPVASIPCVAAQGDYAEVHCGAGTFLLHMSLGELVNRLDPDRFLRVHRSHVVNWTRCSTSRPATTGTCGSLCGTDPR